MPAGLSLTIFRIAQEGLTNVRTHAGTVPTHLEIVGDAGQVRVRVANEAGAAPRADQDGIPHGHGLIGVRERVRAARWHRDRGPDRRRWVRDRRRAAAEGFVVIRVLLCDDQELVRDGLPADP